HGILLRNVIAPRYRDASTKGATQAPCQTGWTSNSLFQTKACNGKEIAATQHSAIDPLHSFFADENYVYPIENRMKFVQLCVNHEPLLAVAVSASRAVDLQEVAVPDPLALAAPTLTNLAAAATARWKHPVDSVPKEVICGKGRALAQARQFHILLLFLVFI
ncbi:MAG TPA: hypothetical protein PJ988_04690, partial [Anaerolinea sp.]|nr:hypothetical protein [Anaerolinea sp.]